MRHDPLTFGKVSGCDPLVPANDLAAKAAPPKRSYKIALWALAVTLLIFVLKVLPYVERW